MSNEKDDKSVINNNFVNEVKTPTNGLFIKESNQIFKKTLAFFAGV